MDEKPGRDSGKVQVMWSETSGATRWCLTFLVLTACGGGGAGPASDQADARVELPSPDAELAHDASVALDAALPDASLAHDSATEAAVVDAGRTDAGSAPVLCGTVAPTACPTPATRYSDVESIFSARCVICHSPLWTGPWPLDEYEHVSDWQSDIRAAMLDCSMPPPDAGIPITVAERQQILSFLRCGLPQ